MRNFEVWGLLLAFALHQIFSPLAHFQSTNVWYFQWTICWQHMTKASMLLLLVMCIVWWPLCTWVFRSAFYSGKLWRAKDMEGGNYESPERLFFPIGCFLTLVSGSQERFHWLQDTSKPQFRNKDCAFGWPFSLLILDPDQAQQTWSRGTLKASKQPKMEEGSEGSKWLHSLGLSVSNI